jgi:hypothetical protein
MVTSKRSDGVVEDTQLLKVTKKESGSLRLFVYRYHDCIVIVRNQ